MASGPTATPTVQLITGWAHGRQAMQPLADALGATYDIRILSGSEVLAARSIPATDYIVTGSMGGLLALELLPERCRRLVLLSSTARFCTDDGYVCGTPEKILRRMILQFKRDPEAVLAEFFRNVHYPHGRGANGSDMKGLNDADALAAGLEYLLQADVRSRIPSIRIPVLMLHGADDRIIPSAASEWLERNLPDSRLRTYKNQGHALLAHHFDDAAREIQRFLPVPGSGNA
jgi:pimeloyl-[acyl-carrier protein] methyl ester esterase